MRPRRSSDTVDCGNFDVRVLGSRGKTMKDKAVMCHGLRNIPAGARNERKFRVESLDLLPNNFLAGIMERRFEERASKFMISKGRAAKGGVRNYIIERSAENAMTYLAV